MKQRPLRILFCLALGALALLAFQRSGLLEAPPIIEPPPRVLQMWGVQVRSYGENGRLIELSGGEVHSNLDDEGMVLEPVTARMQEAEGTTRFRAARGQRDRVNRGIRLRFFDDVVVWTEDERSLSSDEVHLFPADGLVRSPAPVLLQTTDSRLTGDFLETSSELRTGFVAGHARLVRNPSVRPGRVTAEPPPDEPGWDELWPRSGGGQGRSPPGDVAAPVGGGEAQDTTEASTGRARPTTPPPVIVTGDRMPFDDQAGIYRVVGRARAERESYVLTAHEMTYRTRAERLLAEGDVTAREESYVLRCGQLVYKLSEDRAIATSSPVLTQEGPEEGALELRAPRMVFDRVNRRLTAGPGARLVRESREIGRYEIVGEEMQSFYTRQRHTFRGDVRVKSKEMGGQGDRAVFYGDKETLYLIGNAQAWQRNEDGESTNRLAGEKIIHSTRTGRSVVLHGVRIEPSGQTGATTSTAGGPGPGGARPPQPRLGRPSWGQR